MGITTAIYRMKHADRVAVEAQLIDSQIVCLPHAETADYVELLFVLPVVGPAGQRELDRLRSNVESVLLGRGLAIELTSPVDTGNECAATITHLVADAEAFDNEVVTG